MALLRTAPVVHAEGVLEAARMMLTQFGACPGRSAAARKVAMDLLGGDEVRDPA
ncbi:MAG: hypothetical protein R2692_03430 [Microbacterium sp.]